jgi:hypothetical protein
MRISSLNTNRTSENRSSSRDWSLMNSTIEIGLRRALVFFDFAITITSSPVGSH